MNEWNGTGGSLGRAVLRAWRAIKYDPLLFRAHGAEEKSQVDLCRTVRLERVRRLEARRREFKQLGDRNGYARLQLLE